MERQTTRRKVESIDVFISHAGPDKVAIARPLSNKLQALGLNCFLDKRSMEPGDHGPHEMTQAMESAKVGVFILSPEFAARKWTMRELRCFLQRRRDAASSETPPPILIPVFYQLSIPECRNLQPERYEDDDGRNIFEVEKFYSDERQREATTEDVKRELRELADLTGIENLDKATNSLHDEFAHYLRDNLVERISMWVQQKCGEQTHPRDGDDSITPAGGAARTSGAVCDARGRQGSSRSVRNESEREVFKPSFDVPENPPHVILKFRERVEIGTKTTSDAPPEEQLRKKLLGLDAPQSVGAVSRGSRTTVGMKGMGGIGKSCALRGLAADTEIRKKFCDGIYWLVLGQDATKRGVVEQLARITRESGGRLEAKEVREESELDSAVSRVKKWFKGRRILLLIDDVWRNAEVGSCAVTRLQEIADAEKGSCMVFTAREWGLVDGSEEIKFSLKEEASSLEIVLKSAAIGKENIEGLGNQMGRIMRFCRGHPLALSVVGKAIKAYREFANDLGLKDVLEEYLEILQDSPSDVLDKSVDGYIYKNLTSAFSALLSMMDRKRAPGDGYPMSYAEMYESLVVIRRQGWLPLTALCALWGLSGELKARKVLREFVETSLVERKDRVGSDGQRTVGVRLHDLQLDYVKRRCEREGEGEKTWHEKLVQEWGWKEGKYTQGVEWVCGRKWKSDVAEDEYFRDNLCRHLKGAELKDELCKVLSDPRWAAERLTRGEGMGLHEDFKICMSMGGEEERGCEEGGTVWSLRKVAREARLSASYVVRSSREVWFQMYDRLLRFRDKSELIREYLCTIERVAERPWLKSLTPRTNVSDAVQDIFLDQGTIMGMSGCAEKNEVTAWGRYEGHLFRRTFRNGEVKKNVTYEVREYKELIWSQDGKYVGVKGVSMDIQVWDMHTGGTAQRVGREFKLGNVGDTGGRLLDLTGDGKRLAHGKGSKAMLWDVERGMKIKEVRSGPKGEIQRVSFSPDGKRLVSAGTRGSFLMLDGETGERISEYNLPEMADDVYKRFHWVCWSRNGRWVAWRSAERLRPEPEQLLIFDGETGEKIWDETPSSPFVVFHGVSWSEDEKRLRFVREGELCVWDESSRMIIKKAKLSRGRCYLPMSLTGDERWLAAYGSNGLVAVWDAETGARIWSDKEQHSTDVTIVGWLQDGKRMFSADGSGKILIWGWDNLERVRDEEECEEKRSVTSVAWSSDDICTTVAVGEDGDVLMYDVKTGKVIWRDVETHVSAVRCLEISGDNKHVFSVARDGKVATWNMTSGEKLWEARIDVEFEDDEITACWSNDGTKMLARTRAGATLWDGETGDKLWERVMGSRSIRSVAWCGDDTKIAYGEYNSGTSWRVVVRSSRTGEMVCHADEHHKGYVYLMKWSPDDKWIAWSSGSILGSGCRVMIWNWETGATIWSLQEENENVSCLEWSDDGRRVAYGAHRPVIWNFETGQRVEEEKRHCLLKHIAWSQDGSRMATLAEYPRSNLRISNVTSQGIVGVKQYHDVAGFDQSRLRQLINTEGGELSPELDKRLKIRRRGDGVFYTAGDEKLRLATVVHFLHVGWYFSTSCWRFAISGLGEDDKVLYFYELVE